MLCLLCPIHSSPLLPVGEYLLQKFITMSV